MIKRLLLSLLKDLLIMVALLVASAVLPLAAFPLCQSPDGAQIVFWLGPWTTAVWVLLIIQVGGARFWRGRAHVLAWREAHGGYWGTAFRGTLWMFAGLLLSYGAEFAIVLLCQPSAVVMHMLPCATYSPVLLALWRAARG